MEIKINGDKKSKRWRDLNEETDGETVMER